MSSTVPYAKHRVLRVFDKAWARIESLVDRGSGVRWNPIYHTGQIAIFLLVVLLVTGLYLTVFYRPGAERAFASVAGMSDTWLGSLMRTVHRYASGSLIFVSVVHALKSLLRGQFRASRWLAWVSGWVLVVLFWIIGVTGYWLVWDRSAQWLTEWAMQFGRGESILTFIAPDAAGRTFMFFVIVLFVHIFLSVFMLFWILIHVIRVSRVKIWAPRWIMIGTSLILSIVAVWRPATRGMQADMDSLVGTVELDHWYLGLLPLSDRWGAMLVLGVMVLFFVLMIAVPWIGRRRLPARAVVDPDLCNGNGRCYTACPYGAIEIVQHDDGPHERIAVVNPKLCVSCGLCVGVCPTFAIQLPDTATSDIRAGLQTALTSTEKPIVTFACARHATMGTPPGTPSSPSPIEIGSYSEPGGGQASLVTVTAACAGMVNARWLRDATEGGAERTVVVTCPAADCRFEEGPQQLSERMGRGWLRNSDSVHALDVSPADPRPLRRLMARLVSGRPREDQTDLPRWRSGLAIAVGTVVLALLVALPVGAVRDSTAIYPADGGIRIGFAHGGQFIDDGASVDFEGTFPEGVDPGQILGRARHPVGLRVSVDGTVLIDDEHEPSGIRGQGRASTMEMLWLGPGTYAVSISIMDDGENWDEVFTGDVPVEPGQIVTLYWDDSEGIFVR